LRGERILSKYIKVFLFCQGLGLIFIALTSFCKHLFTFFSLAGFLGLSAKGIEWNLKKLKSEGLIERVGADKGDHWKVCRKR